jgi:hypothetical protein
MFALYVSSVKLTLEVSPYCQMSEKIPPLLVPEPVPVIVTVPCQFFTPRNSSTLPAPWTGAAVRSSVRAATE